MSNKKTILIVDDDPDLLENTAYMIKSMGYDVLTAENGADGVEKFKDIQPNLTLMDIKMPKMDGYDAFFKMKQIDPEAKVFLITAFSLDEKKLLKAKSMSLLGIINKPYTFEKLEDVINKNA